MSKFKYQENDPEVSRRHAEKKGDFDRPISDDFKVFTAKEGKNRIRILPRTWKDSEGPRHWAFPLHLHYSVGADKGRYPCPQKMWNEDCPICEERARLDAAGDKEAAKDLRPGITMMCWVIDRNNEEEGPQIFLMPASKLEGPICDLSRDPETGETLVIDHPEKGYDVTFTRKGTTKTNTEYSAAAIARKSTFLSEDSKEEEEWLEYVMKHPLPTVVNKFDAAHIERVFSGAVTKKDEDDDDDQPPPRSAARRPREDADEEDAPRSRTRSSEEKEEERPARRRREEPEDDETAELDEDRPSTRRRSSEDSDGEDRGSSRGRTTSARSSRGDEEEKEEERPARRRREEPEEDEKPSDRLRREVDSGLKRRERSGG
jgi:hypothetical protein